MSGDPFRGGQFSGYGNAVLGSAGPPAPKVSRSSHSLSSSSSSSSSLSLVLSTGGRTAPPNEGLLAKMKEERDRIAANPNNKLVHTWNKAIKSVTKVAFPISNYDQARAIENIGPFIAKKIMEFLGMPVVDESVSSQRVVSNGVMGPLADISNPYVSQDSVGYSQKSRVSEADSVGSCAAAGDQNSGSASVTTTKKKSTGARAYVPKPRSGAWAILRALTEAFEERGSLVYRKEEVIQLSQPFCDTDMLPAGQDQYYGAWSSVKTLVEKGLCAREGNPPRYSITDAGLIVGKSILATLSANQELLSAAIPAIPAAQSFTNTVKPPAPTSRDGSSASMIPRYHSTLVPASDIPPVLSRERADHGESTECFSIENILATDAIPQFDVAKYGEDCFLNPQRFSNAQDDPPALIPTLRDLAALGDVERYMTSRRIELKMILDCREKRGKTDRSYFFSELLAAGVPVERRALEIGDIAWVVQLDGQPTEYVAPFIIERKTIADLDCSIKDGRYQEQKSRLRRSGIGHVIYLLEGKWMDVPEPQPLMTAAMTTQGVDGFYVRNTRSSRETVDFLSRYHRFILASLHSNNDLLDKCLELPFDHFSETMNKTKHMRFQEFFRKQIATIKGCSGVRAELVADKYGTPSNLWTAYLKKSKQDAESLVSGLRSGSLCVGQRVSSKLAEVFVSNSYSKLQSSDSQQ
eukprot:ANDGO_04526.mRNA.1 Crossover junction endonuclease mus81